MFVPLRLGRFFSHVPEASDMVDAEHIQGDERRHLPHDGAQAGAGRVRAQLSGVHCRGGVFSRRLAASDSIPSGGASTASPDVGNTASDSAGAAAGTYSLATGLPACAAACCYSADVMGWWSEGASPSYWSSSSLGAIVVAEAVVSNWPGHRGGLPT